MEKFLSEMVFLCQSMQEKLPVAGSLYFKGLLYFSGIHGRTLCLI